MDVAARGQKLASQKPHPVGGKPKSGEKHKPATFTPKQNLDAVVDAINQLNHDAAPGTALTDARLKQFQDAVKKK